MSLSPLLIPNFLYNRALDKYFQPPPPKNCKKKKKIKQEQNLAASSITCLLWRDEVRREHFRVFCFSPLIILGEMVKPLISYPQIFLKFLLYFMIDVMKKKSFFLINLLSPSSFYKSLKIQIFPTWVYSISFGYLDRLS